MHVYFKTLKDPTTRQLAVVEYRIENERHAHKVNAETFQEAWLDRIVSRKAKVSMAGLVDVSDLFTSRRTVEVLGEHEDDEGHAGFGHVLSSFGKNYL